jgi:excinuclease ABC subunit B
MWPQVVFVSATPGPYELEKTRGEIVEQVIRPTGLVDPEGGGAGGRGQVADLHAMACRAGEPGASALVTTLTKRLAEDLSATWPTRACGRGTCTARSRRSSA